MRTNLHEALGTKVIATGAAVAIGLLATACSKGEKHTTEQKPAAATTSAAPESPTPTASSTPVEAKTNVDATVDFCTTPGVMDHIQKIIGLEMSCAYSNEDAARGQTTGAIIKGTSEDVQVALLIEHADSGQTGPLSSGGERVTINGQECFLIFGNGGIICPDVEGYDFFVEGGDPTTARQFEALAGVELAAAGVL